jgi:hypothetical protein
MTLGVSMRRLALVLALFTAGCTTGYLNGRLTGHGGLRTPVEFEWTAGLRSSWPGSSADRGTIKTTLPTGETFSGRFMQVNGTRSDSDLHSIVKLSGFDGPWPVWEPADDAWGSTPDLARFRSAYADRIVATLQGDKGHAMRCRFRLFDPPAAFRGGGSGECQVSAGGGTVTVQF